LARGAHREGESDGRPARKHEESPGDTGSHKRDGSVLVDAREPLNEFGRHDTATTREVTELGEGSRRQRHQRPGRCEPLGYRLLRAGLVATLRTLELAVARSLSEILEEALFIRLSE
jgi:hypothetical protein